MKTSTTNEPAIGRLNSNIVLGQKPKNKKSKKKKRKVKKTKQSGGS